MAAADHLALQFQYHPPEMGYGSHRITAHQPTGEYAGHLLWSSTGVRNIQATPERQGIGTALWSEGHRLAAENPKIPKPKHSPDRTDAGDAWARSVGGRLPRLRR